jgi:hypothetical protein
MHFVDWTGVGDIVVDDDWVELSWFWPGLLLVLWWIGNEKPRYGSAQVHMWSNLTAEGGLELCQEPMAFDASLFIILNSCCGRYMATEPGT